MIMINTTNKGSFMKGFNKGIAIYAIVASVAFSLCVAFFIYTAIFNIENLGNISRLLFIIVLAFTIATIIIILFTHDEDNDISNATPTFNAPLTVSQTPLMYQTPSPTNITNSKVTNPNNAVPIDTPAKNPTPNNTVNINNNSNNTQQVTDNLNNNDDATTQNNSDNTNQIKNDSPATKTNSPDNKDPNNTQQPLNNDASNTTNDDSALLETPPVQPNNNPELAVLQDTYSTNTGVVKGNLLIDRLNAELVRASGNGEDLGLITMECPITKLVDNELKDIADIIVKTSRVRDYVFDYDDGIFFIIVPNVDVAGATDLSKNILKEVTKILSMGSKVFFGVTSRAGRMIGAERLINECTQAVKKASTEDTSKIVSFHVDLDKYRDEVLKA